MRLNISSAMLLLNFIPQKLQTKSKLESQREREVSYWNDWTHIDPCCVKWASGTDR